MKVETLEQRSPGGCLINGKPVRPEFWEFVFDLWRQGLLLDVDLNTESVTILKEVT